MDTLERHLKYHNEMYNCPTYKYTSLRRDAVKRHSSRHLHSPKRDKDQCSLIMTGTNSHQDRPRPTVLETQPYQADPSQINSYLYQQTLPKNIEIFL